MKSFNKSHSFHKLYKAYVSTQVRNPSHRFMRTIIHMITSSLFLPKVQSTTANLQDYKND